LQKKYEKPLFSIVSFGRFPSGRGVRYIFFVFISALSSSVFFGRGAESRPRAIKFYKKQKRMPLPSLTQNVVSENGVLKLKYFVY